MAVTGTASALLHRDVDHGNISDVDSPPSTVYGHLDKTKTVPRQPEKTEPTKP